MVQVALLDEKHAAAAAATADDVDAKRIQYEKAPNAWQNSHQANSKEDCGKAMPDLLPLLTQDAQRIYHRLKGAQLLVHLAQLLGGKLGSTFV